MKNLIIEKAREWDILLILIAFLTPIIPLLLLVGFCIAADTILGIWKAKKRREKITSRKLSNVVTKMLLYQATIILFFMIEKWILGDIIGQFSAIPLLLTKVVAAVIVFIELKSMDENYKIIMGFSIWDKFKILLRRAKETKDEFGDFKKE